MKNRYRDQVVILRRPMNDAGGGYTQNTWVSIGTTSAQVRDESPEEYAAAESSTIGHIKTFTMREREIREDDALMYRQEIYRVRQVDRLYNRGREMIVRASVPKSRYTI